MYNVLTPRYFASLSFVPFIFTDWHCSFAKVYKCIYMYIYICLLCVCELPCCHLLTIFLPLVEHISVHFSLSLYVCVVCLSFTHSNIVRCMCICSFILSAAPFHSFTWNYFFVHLAALPNVPNKCYNWNVRSVRVYYVCLFFILFCLWNDDNRDTTSQSWILHEFLSTTITRE